MIKNYFFTFTKVSIATTTLLVSFLSHAQKAKIFTTADFDLSGNVKYCLVSTDYGKEEFNFNEDGFLTKLKTLYSNDSDYDITYYKYGNGEILEKRVENYRDGIFDKNTSIANIYTIDTTHTKKKITEKIISYAKEFLDQYEYTYDEEGKLVNIVRNNEEGIENTIVAYANVKGEVTTTYTIDGELQKSIRVSEHKTKAYIMQRIELTKEYLEGKPHKAVEQIFNTNDKLVSENTFFYDTISNSFVSQELKTLTYNDLGIVSEIKTKTGKSVVVKNFIYQYDNGDKGNWIKQIITPDNTYITRKIKYYETPVIEE